jgi:hypothetical protein
LEQASKSNQESDLKTFSQNPGLREVFMQRERFGSLNDDQITHLLFPGRRLITQAASR